MTLERKEEIVNKKVIITAKFEWTCKDDDVAWETEEDIAKAIKAMFEEDEDFELLSVDVEKG